MIFTTSFNSLEKLYELHLNLIKNLTFTFREIDVIACIMHNRGEKKIASLLLVSPRTISAHVYNIMGKLGFSSKDQIIDFIETSDKINIIKEYYLHLLVKSSFEQKLIKIASQVNRAKLDFYYNKNDKINISEPLYQSLKKHLQLANIFLHEANTTDLNDKLVIDLNDITEQNYYNDLLQIISKIINSNLVVEILKEFHEGYKLTQDIYEGKTNHLAISNNIESKPRLFKKKFFIIFLVLCLTTTLIFGFKHFLLPEKTENNSSEIIKALGDFVEALKNEQFTADNTTPEQTSHNHNIIKKVEKLLEYKNSKKVQEYFDKAEMSSEFLTNYLYNLQALSSYYMYNMYNGDKARNILMHAKELVEHYINSRSNIKSDFNQLSNAEILAELQIVDDLPQIYTRIIYSLGRTYIYDNDIFLGKKYFELSKYLGNKLGLFEGYLSDISGILVIEKELALLHIKEEKNNIAKQILNQTSNSFDKMRQDDTSYILDYKPGINQQKIIIPKNQPYNLFECGNKMILIYIALFSITKSTKEINEYINVINNILVANSTAKGLFEIATQVPKKKLAALYNNLGNIMTLLWQYKELDNLVIQDQTLKKTISSFLKSDVSDNLELAELLFTTAKDISRNSYFTKADSYDGLAKIYQIRLEHDYNIVSEEQKKELVEKIKLTLQKAQSINQKLNRKNKFN